VKHLDLLSPELDKELAAQNIRSLIANAVNVVDNVTQIEIETATEVALATTVTTTAVQLDEAEAGNATATVTTTEAKENALVMATEGRALEHENPTHWTVTRGHALGSVPRDVHAHDQPRINGAAVAPAHLHALVPNLGTRGLEARQLVPIGRVAKSMALMMTSMLRVTLWKQPHLKHLRALKKRRRKAHSAWLHIRSTAGSQMDGEWSFSRRSVKRKRNKPKRTANFNQLAKQDTRST
jgi:hypothetical protein